MNQTEYEKLKHEKFVKFLKQIRLHFVLGSFVQDKEK